MGTHSWWWMPFWPPFLTAGEQFVKNTSSCRNKLITVVFYQIKQNPARVPSANPCGWPLTHQIGAILWINSIGGGKRLTMVMMFVGEVVSVLGWIPVLFLPCNMQNLWCGSFRSRPNPQLTTFLQLSYVYFLAGDDHLDEYIFLANENLGGNAAHDCNVTNWKPILPYQIMFLLLTVPKSKLCSKHNPLTLRLTNTYLRWSSLPFTHWTGFQHHFAIPFGVPPTYVNIYSWLFSSWWLGNMQRYSVSVEQQFLGKVGCRRMRGLPWALGSCSVV